MFRAIYNAIRALPAGLKAMLNSGNSGGYAAGKNNRLTAGKLGSRLNENAIPRSRIDNIRNSSWELYRDNCHARKIVRSLESKVIGRGYIPQSQAKFADGTPHTEFRKRVRELWTRIENEIDFTGKPGRGGQSFCELQKLALRSVILSGEVLWRNRNLAEASRKARGLELPFQVQLVDARRLDETRQNTAPMSDGHAIFAGIELDSNDSRIAYYLWNRTPNDPIRFEFESTRVNANSIGHLFIREDVDQMRGVPWFAPVLLRSRDIGEYEYNELKAAAMAACVVLGYRRSSGQTSFGTANPPDWDLTDADGNKITNIQPGMFVDLGQTGELQSFNPQRPNQGACEFIAHQLRSTAAGMPGTKSSTVTGDYRNSSFSSERSADNDVWPEIEGLQDWFSASFMQPIYEQVIDAAVISGYFDGVTGFSIDDYNARRVNYRTAFWQGPVQRSIKPTEDVDAATMRIKAGISTPQIEAAVMGRDWRDILAQFKEFREYAVSQGIEDNIVDQMLGIETQVNVTETEDEDAAIAVE